MYDAFISYSHAKDRPIAAALQSVMQTLGKPWWQRRKMRVFRDETSLTATPEMWPTIEAALTSSQFLVLMASPEAAASEWVDKEVETWFAHWGGDEGAARLLIALTDGELAWKKSDGDFGWGPEVPLPPSMKARYKSEPLWVDLRAYRAAGRQASKANQEFASHAAKIAARILAIPLEDLLSEEVRQQRRALRLAWSAAGSLMVFAGLAVLAGTLAKQQWDVAIVERDRAVDARVRALASLATQLKGEGDTVRATLVATEALTLARTSRDEGARTDAQDTLLSSYSMLRERSYYSASDGILAKLVISPDGARTLAIGDQGGRLLDGDLRPLRFELQGASTSARGGAFSPDSATLVIASNDGNIAVFDVATGKKIRSVKAHQKAAWDVAFSPDGTQMLSTSADGTIKIWNTRDLSPLAVLKVKRPPQAGTSDVDDDPDLVRTAVFSPTGRIVVAAYQDSGHVRLWDIKSQSVAWDIDNRADSTVGEPGYGAEVYSVAISPNEKFLLVGTSNEDVHVWDLGTRKVTQTLRGHVDRVFSVAYSGDGAKIATGSRNPTLRLWNADAGEPYAILRGHATSVYSVAFGPGGDLIASASDDGTARIWDATPAVASRLEMTRATGIKRTEPVRDSRFWIYSPDGSRAMKTNGAEFIEIWDPRSMEQISRMNVGQSSFSVEPIFSSDGQKLFTAKIDGIFGQIWSTETGKEIAKLRQGTRIVDATFNVTGTLIGTASQDTSARIWNADTGEQIVVYRGHQASVETITFNADATRVLTCGRDGVARVWKTVSGVDVLAIRMECLAGRFGDDGRSLILGDRNADVFIHLGGSAQELLHKGISGVSRCLTLDQRRQLLLDPAPPDWCITGVDEADQTTLEKWRPKWPYQTVAWRQWLEAKRAGRNLPMPR